VDGNRTNRAILGHQLQSWGMQPRLASSGKGALDLLEKEAYVNMPQVYGVALALASLPEIKLLKILLVE
jgi:hypothetical protein